MKTSKGLTVLLSVLTALTVLTGAVAVPLLCRPFYYAQIGPLGLTRTGLTEEQIRAAFDDVMDYCLGLRPDFSAGILPFSQSGADHFADVRVLFLLDLWVLGLSLAALIGMLVLCRMKRTRPQPLLGRGPGFWGAAGLGAVFLLIGGLAALDFQRAFVVFHSLFFPGKTNWIFDWRTDPIILLLPEEFFRNCALLIFVLLLLWCAVLIGADLWAGKKRRKQAPPSASCSGCPGCQ